MFSLPIVRYVIKAAVFDRIVLSLFLLIGVGISLSIFLGSASATESHLFSLVFAAGGLRLISILGLVLFIVFHIRRSFETKDVDYLLTRPLSRVSYIVSHSVAFSCLAVFFASLVTASLFILASRASLDGYILWGVSIVVEFVIIANASLFFAMVLNNAASAALSVFALYILSRLIGQILGIIDLGISFKGGEAVGKFMELISLIVPRLDLMGQTSWLVYGVTENSTNYSTIILQGCVYTFLLVTAACVDLVRRQF